MKAVEKAKEKGKKFWDSDVSKTIVGGAIVLGSMVLGYAIGAKVANLTFNSGMAVVIKEKPEIETLFIEAVESIKDKRNSK